MIEIPTPGFGPGVKKTLPPSKPPTSMKTGLLLQEYREVLLRLGADRTDVALSRRADALEQEINRRIAW